MERVCVIVLLILLAPLLAALAVITSVMSRRSPLVAHLRVGQNGQPLWVLKYRTMWNANGAGSSVADMRLIQYIDENPRTLKQPEDPRVTSRFARFCRRHSIDELPQLIHVALGEMSLVGPRPITKAELQQHYASHADEILSVRPGLTGLWQIMGRNRLNHRQRLRLDRFLVRHCCLRLYMRIVLRTIPRVLAGTDAW